MLSFSNRYSRAGLGERSFQVFRKRQLEREKETGEVAGRRPSVIAAAAFALSHKTGYAAVHSKVMIELYCKGLWFFVTLCIKRFHSCIFAVPSLC